MHDRVRGGSTTRGKGGSRCARSYRRGRLVTLRALAGSDFEFQRWNAACVGTVPTCIVAADRAKTVRAVFTRLPAELGVNTGVSR